MSIRIGENDFFDIGNPWVFFVVTLAYTWLFWGLAILLGINATDPMGLALLLLGLTGPGVAGIGFVYLLYEEEGRRDFWARLVEIRRLGLKWFLVLVFIPPAVNIVAAGVSLAAGESVAVWGVGGDWFPITVFALLPALFVSTIPPLLEELGWRGYVLDRLQLRWSALTASLILGVVWSTWHLPLFLIEGTYQQSLGVGSVGFWGFTLGAIVVTPVFTWLYNNTERSILGVILLHGWMNFNGEASDIPELFFYGTWILLAILVVIIWGQKSLRRDQDIPRPPQFG